jgi:hypothetical protein
VKVIDKGSFIGVVVTAGDLYDFASMWPGSRLDELDDVYFEFDRDGNLVDVEPHDLDGEDAAALSQDAWEFAVTELEDPSAKLKRRVKEVCRDQ